ncbi:MAG TPA: DNA polymerase III subunit epsilon [Gallionellaceae bacterium]|nr:DNA polymerase III subunit epsilon [Gallionellaceae bacterium]
MNMLQRWFMPKPRLTAVQAERLAAWLALPEVGMKGRFERSRCVVVDVETTGLNLMTDTLISIGAVAVVDGKIALGDSFYVVMQQRESSRKENILVHGITGTAQREGVEPVEALLAFLEYVGNSPLVAFHVTFDETMIRRAVRQYLGHALKHPWLDLAYVMPALYPPLAFSHRVLDSWIGLFKIRIETRHHALADALATAQLLQVAQAKARQKKDITDLSGLRDLEREQRWVNGVS